MLKAKMSTVVSNSKLSIASFKSSLDIIKSFSILTFNNKHTKSAIISQSLLRVLASSINVFNYFFCWRIKNLNSNNIRN